MLCPVTYQKLKKVQEVEEEGKGEMKENQKKSEEVQHEVTADEGIEGGHSRQMPGERDISQLGENTNKDGDAFCTLKLHVTSHCT